LCTASFGWNSFGIGFTINTVYPKNVSIGFGRNFIFRKILEAKNIDEIMKVVKLNQSTGYNIQIMDINQKKIWNIEKAPE